MSAAEFIHPDWITGWHHIRGIFRRRGDDAYTLEAGDSLIFDGWDITAPGRNQYGDPAAGRIVHDRKGHAWEITRAVSYEQDRGGFTGWERRVRVYARRADGRDLPGAN
jgi:hypothetical protein